MAAFAAIDPGFHLASTSCLSQYAHVRATSMPILSVLVHTTCASCNPLACCKIQFVSSALCTCGPGKAALKATAMCLQAQDKQPPRFSAVWHEEPVCPPRQEPPSRHAGKLERRRLRPRPAYRPWRISSVPTELHLPERPRAKSPLQRSRPTPEQLHVPRRHWRMLGDVPLAPSSAVQSQENCLWGHGVTQKKKLSRQQVKSHGRRFCCSEDSSSDTASSVMLVSNQVARTRRHNTAKGQVHSKRAPVESESEDSSSTDSTADRPVQPIGPTLQPPSPNAAAALRCQRVGSPRTVKNVSGGIGKYPHAVDELENRFARFGCMHAPEATCPPTLPQVPLLEGRGTRLEENSAWAGRIFKTQAERAKGQASSAGSMAYKKLLADLDALIKRRQEDKARPGEVGNYLCPAVSGLLGAYT